MHSVRGPVGRQTAIRGPGNLGYSQDGYPLTQQRGSILSSIICPGRDQCGPGRSLTWTRRAIPAAMAIAGMLLPALHSGPAAAAVTRHEARWITYLGRSFEIPRSWRVIDLGRHRRTCVRFDRHTVYLGIPSRNQACPSLVVGTTEAMLIGPAPRHVAHVSVENKVARQITVIARRIHITATFDAHPKEIRRILASAGLPRPVPDPPAAPAGRWLPARATNYHGRGFDTCAAPSEAAMRPWWFDTPYAAVGIYIGGSDAACAQPNLTPSWLRHEFAQGWHFIPMYVGPQAFFGELTNSSASQGTAAATDAVHQAQRLGFGPRTPIYYDMEGYLPGQSTRVLQFLSAWTRRLHALGYSSGVYSSSSSGIADLAHQFGRGRYAIPDVIYDALWNGNASTHDPVFRPSEWANHHRVHQYNGNVTQTYGGVTMNIDQDYLDVRIPQRPPSPPTVAYPAGAAATVYTGLAFDACTAPSLATIAAWGRSPYHAIGVYIGGINRGCNQPHLTANWVTAVSEKQWRLLPTYVGLQPPCLITNSPARALKPAAHEIDPSAAASEGTAAADDAAAKAEALGMRNGSALYDYIGKYSQTDATCRNAVLGFVSAWTSELHRLGFLAGVYVNLNPGARDLSSLYTSTSFGRPDALWGARRDGNSSLTGWSAVPDNQWALHQRAKQYRGPHNEAYGGATIHIDSDNLDVPVATVAYGETITSPVGLNARTGPSTSSPVARSYAPRSTVQVVCQAPGSAVATTNVWDKLTDGTYVTDFYVSTHSKTGHSPPLPRCVYPYPVTDSAGLDERSGPGTSYPVSGQLPYGALASVICQKSGSATGTTSVWDELQDGQWVSDLYVATPSKTTYSGPAPRC
jgi:hypothetical protein